MAYGSADDGYVVLDPERMRQLQLDRGLSARGLARLADISPTTAGRFFNRKCLHFSTVRKAFDALDIDDIRPYLIGGGVAENEFGQRDADVLAEWKIEYVLTRPVQLSNGLSFRTFKLRHHVLPNTYGRGKCYELSQLNTRDAARVREQLLRHPLVCRSVAEHKHFPTNERVVFSADEQRFWVIDQWFDGPTLEDRLRDGALRGQELAKVMTQMLHALRTLHEQKIIRRELSSQYIVLSEPNGDVLFTELELAKLVEGASSVSESWDADPFRAPEIENDEITQSVDLYSWAQVLFHAATGRLPSSPATETQFENLELPKSVKEIARRCVNLSYKFRPSGVDEVLQKLGDWYRE